MDTCVTGVNLDNKLQSLYPPLPLPETGINIEILKFSDAVNESTARCRRQNTAVRQSNLATTFASQLQTSVQPQHSSSLSNLATTIGLKTQSEMDRGWGIKRAASYYSSRQRMFPRRNTVHFGTRERGTRGSCLAPSYFMACKQS